VVYEHCWSYSRSLPAYDVAWPYLVADTLTILAAVSAAGIHLAGPTGLGEPIADARTGIVVNGDAARHENGATFLLRPPTPWAAAGSGGEPPAVIDSCQTARHPYDVAVTAVLLRFGLALPGAFTVLSDGRWNHEWAHGAHTTGRRTRAGRLSARALIGDLFGEHPTRRPLL
jgi:hypothetical protein